MYASVRQSSRAKKYSVSGLILKKNEGGKSSKLTGQKRNCFWLYSMFFIKIPLPVSIILVIRSVSLMVWEEMDNFVIF